MPPSYGELPTPTSEKALKVNENNIEKLIGKSKEETSQTLSNQNKSLETSILGRIKKN